MAISRDDLYSEGTSPGPTGLELLEQYNDLIDALLDSAYFRLASVGGTANVITGNSEPVSLPSTGYVTGMKFSFVATATNTGAVTLNVDGEGAVGIKNVDGSALGANQIVSGTNYFVEYDGTDFVLQNSPVASSNTGFSRTVYTASATWTNSFDPDAIVIVELWGAGGGGNASFGGGGGAYAKGIFRAGDLSGTETITVPSGGSVGNIGGDASFGSVLTAYGGGGATSVGGGGGGEHESGSGSTPGRVGGGSGATNSTTDASNALTLWGGGGGGFNANSLPGDAAWGGGGGTNTGGLGESVYGGNGGTAGVAGSDPAGGGGQNSSGGKGQAIVTVIGG